MPVPTKRPNFLVILVDGEQKDERDVETNARIWDSQISAASGARSRRPIWIS